MGRGRHFSIIALYLLQRLFPILFPSINPSVLMNCFDLLHVQISKQASNLFDDIMRQDRIPIDMSSPLEPFTLAAYIEDCRMKLWEHAFNSYFKGQDRYKKTEEFVGYKGSVLVVRRVIFRYSSNP